MNARGSKAVVIGAGIGGLAVALRLAVRGWAVTVCEQTGAPGGKMNRWQANGFRFDTGPSLITMPWVFEELFAAAGARLHEHIEPVCVHPLADYHFSDGTRFTHTADLPAWLATVRRLEGGEAAGFLAFMGLGARLFELSKATFFKRSPFDRPDPSAARALRHMPLRFGWGNYDRTVRHFFRSPYLRQMFNRYITYVGSSPYRTPATLSVIPFVEYAFGGWHVKGGLYRIIEAIAALGRDAGVEILTRTRVTAITRRAGRAAGVDLEGGTHLDADVVIMNGDASCAPALLGLAGRGLDEKERSMSGLVFLFALKKTLPGHPHHSVFFSADYEEEFRQLFEERRFPDDPTVYVNMPSRTDRTMTPGQGEVMFVMANAPANDGDAWDEPMVAAARRRVTARLQQAGCPDFEQDVVASAVWTPRKMAEQYGMPGGAIYGQVSHGWRGAFLRPPNKDRRVPGLYYVSGSTHPGGGTPTVLMSAAITSDLIRRHEGL
ncbi:MAG: phytoene desaturase [Kiritimatiellae bacterium]|nr:phytoene desaturase [Kiritimatiellia bacterium]